MAHIFQSQLTSLISEGTFAEFPDLRMTMVEGGWTWLPSLMWRLDKNWKALRREIPWTARPPSEYIREHVRFTPSRSTRRPNPKHLRQIVDQLGSDDLLMFSTDYPHWHADDADGTPADRAAGRADRKIMSENARAGTVSASSQVMRVVSGSRAMAKNDSATEDPDDGHDRDEARIVGGGAADTGGRRHPHDVRVERCR